MYNKIANEFMQKAYKNNDNLDEQLINFLDNKRLLFSVVEIKGDEKLLVGPIYFERPNGKMSSRWYDFTTILEKVVGIILDREEK